VAELKKTKAKLIWASTTPVPEAGPKAGRRPEDVPKYNEAAAKVMTENGVAIDDLYGFALPKVKELQRPQNVHFSPKGSQTLGEQVAASIKAALGK
jgi:acyl-CoA thioesterase-1